MNLGAHLMTDREIMQQALDMLVEPHPHIRTSFTDSIKYREKINQVIESLRQALAQPEQVSGNASDGYHTFNELYDFRKAYNAALFNEWAQNNKYSVHKSKRHFNGEDCFGGGWFIVVAQLPDGQISNHYEMKDWDKFLLPETDTALFEYDNHTGADVLHRLFSLRPLAQPEQEPVAWMMPDYGDVLSASEADGTGIYNIPLYTTPPRKPWVGLTDDELQQVVYDMGSIGDMSHDEFDIARAVMAKLKEKNNAV